MQVGRVGNSDQTLASCYKLNKKIILKFKQTKSFIYHGVGRNWIKFKLLQYELNLFDLTLGRRQKILRSLEISRDVKCTAASTSLVK